MITAIENRKAGSFDPVFQFQQIGLSVHPETASFGPGRRFRFFAILGIDTLCLRLQKRSGLALNQNLPFPDGHFSGRLSIGWLMISQNFESNTESIRGSPNNFAV